MNSRLRTRCASLQRGLTRARGQRVGSGKAPSPALRCRMLQHTILWGREHQPTPSNGVAGSRRWAKKEWELVRTPSEKGQRVLKKFIQRDLTDRRRRTTSA